MVDQRMQMAADVIACGVKARGDGLLPQFAQFAVTRLAASKEIQRAFFGQPPNVSSLSPLFFGIIFPVLKGFEEGCGRDIVRILLA